MLQWMIKIKSKFMACHMKGLTCVDCYEKAAVMAENV